MEHKVRSLESTSSSIWSANSLTYSQKLDHLPWLWPWRIHMIDLESCKKYHLAWDPANEHLPSFLIKTTNIQQTTQSIPWNCPKKHLDFRGPTSPRPGPQHRRAVRRVSVASIRASKKNRPSRRKNRQPTETIRTMGFFVDCLILFFWYVEIFLVWMDFYLACTLFFSLNGFIWVLNMGIFWSILAEIGIKKWHVPNFLWALHVWTYQNIVFIWV